MGRNQIDLLIYRNRFCMVDDILILLYYKLFYYGKTFYDQKS